MIVARKGLRAAFPGRPGTGPVQPDPAARRVAVRAGVSIAIPLLALWLTGHLTWAPYATFGAFTSLYGRAEAHPARLRMQLQAGTVLTLAVAIGAAAGCSPDRRWLAVPVVTGCAVAGSLLSGRLRWHPPGPMFIVFAAAAVGSIAGPAVRIPVALGVAAVTALLAVAIGTAGRLGWPSLRPARTPRCVPDEPAPREPAGREPAQPATAPARWAWSQAARYGVAVLASGSAATAIGIGHPYWAMVATAAAVTGPDTTARLTRAGQRVAGTLIGVFIAAAILAPHLPVPVPLTTAALLQAAAELLVGRNYALAVIFLTPIALIMGSLAQPVSGWSLIHDRTIETVLGAAIGALVSLAAHWAAERSGRVRPRPGPVK